MKIETTLTKEVNFAEAVAILLDVYHNEVMEHDDEFNHDEFGKWYGQVTVADFKSEVEDRIELEMDINGSQDGNPTPDFMTYEDLNGYSELYHFMANKIFG